jgi:hypothetical protein
VALAATLFAPAGVIVGGQEAAQDIVVKAAYLYNFAKFTEWPALPASAPMVVCVVGDDALTTAVITTVRGQIVSGHALEARRAREGVAWRDCHLLFVAAADTRQSSAALDAIKTLPVLTVSDGKGFSQANGIIELYVEDGRIRIAINVDAAERSRLRISSRLLGLAKIVRDSRAQ